MIVVACLTLAACGSSSQRAMDAGARDDDESDARDTAVMTDGQNAADGPAAIDTQAPVDTRGPADAPGNADAGNDADALDAGGRTDTTIPDDTCTTTVAYQTLSPILTVLPGRAGLFVVHADQVVHVSRGGTIHRSLPWPREILAAVWSANRAVILDRGVLTTLDENLATLGRINLIESCVQAVAADNDRVVCGPSNDWERIFYTYEVTTPALVARSQGFTYEGIPMRAVPGRPWFLTPDALFALDATGAATQRLDLSFSTSAQPILPLTFAGNPATFAVDRTGKVFQLQPTCQPSCFVAAGTWTSTFLGGSVIDGPDGSVLLPGVTGAERIDIATGTVVSAGQVSTDTFANVVTAVYDPFCGVVTTVVDRFSDGLVHSVEQMPYQGFDGGVGP